ncbi:pentatricopeptide repeat-containing protein At1g71460, chloroplastic [Rosa rugosa]|uniref:pentatricopeptide repeat-containing protein At1g71460, chloroplastic n=1 Tax=Rosa rugosa TaxID=74645 RepID=UPI002B402F5B|nr:pentatricopeptide repeat-containing protein At1g71460, chloroplastic [Rosa rugosa]XP_062001515.1 pentatricopeptide repeat-containing protein At1g71460, chloroplastic [Rosa rugosa]
MEGLSVASPSLSLQIHSFPPKIRFTATGGDNPNNHHAFKLHALSRRRRKPPKFEENDAFPDSLPLHTKNPHAVYKDIQRFARQNKITEALAILDYLDQNGIPVNATTFSHLITACVRTRSLDTGKKIHTYIRINGLEANEFLRRKLVNMYTSFGSVDDAHNLFDDVSSKNVYSWNALLRGTVVAGGKRYRDVLETYSEMRGLGVEMNVYSFSNVIKSFAGASALSQGLRTHGLLVKNGFVDSVIVGTSLIDMYFKCGKIKLARQVFEEMGERDVVLWGAMIAGFAHNRLYKEALEHLRMMVDEGIRPNSVILTSILPVIGEVSARKLGQEAHAYVLKTKSYLKQAFVQSALIDMYCKCGDMEMGRRVFYSSMERNAICWTALMSGYAANGRLEQALRSVIWMQQEGFKPDVVTVATALPVCAELKDLKRGKEIHAYAVKNCFLPNVSIVSSLMVMYSKCGVLEYSIRLFDGMERRNVITWTAMIDSHVENGCLDEALGVIRSMLLSKHRPDSVAMSRMLAICGGLKNLKLGKEMHAQVLKKNFESVHFVSAELVKMYGHCGAIDHAKSFFDTIPVKGSMTWTAIIEAYGYAGMYQEAISLFDQMRSKDFTPNNFTFQVVLSICDRAELVDDACRIFRLMSRRYKTRVSQEQYSLLIELLTRSGRIEEAQRFIQMSSSLV